MMLQKSSVIGVCPACGDIVTFKNKILFFVCPHCGQTVSANQSRTNLEVMCADPMGSAAALDYCLQLEEQYGAEIPLEILIILKKHHPHNEQVAFTAVRMSGYRPDLSREYLKNFCAVKKQVPWASEFLENALVPENAAMLPQFTHYIENKLYSNDQKRFNEKLNEIKENYVGRSESGEGMGLMYTYYIAGTVINIIMAAVFIWVLSLHILLHFLIAAVLFSAELLLLFLHNRAYGNRFGLDPRERLLLTVFICSVLVAIGGLLIGWIS